MAIPQLLNDIISVLLLLAPSAALVSLVIAGVSLRREGTMTFAIGGGFTKWMFWAVVFLTLQGPARCSAGSHQPVRTQSREAAQALVCAVLPTCRDGIWLLLLL